MESGDDEDESVHERELDISKLPEEQQALLRIESAEALLCMPLCSRRCLSTSQNQELDVETVIKHHRAVCGSRKERIARIASIPSVIAHARVVHINSNSTARTPAGDAMHLELAGFKGDFCITCFKRLLGVEQPNTWVRIIGVAFNGEREVRTTWSIMCLRSSCRRTVSGQTR